MSLYKQDRHSYAVSCTLKQVQLVILHAKAKNALWSTQLRPTKNVVSPCCPVRHRRWWSLAAGRRSSSGNSGDDRNHWRPPSSPRQTPCPGTCAQWLTIHQVAETGNYILIYVPVVFFTMQLRQFYTCDGIPSSVHFTRCQGQRSFWYRFETGMALAGTALALTLCCPGQC